MILFKIGYVINHTKVKMITLGNGTLIPFSALDPVGQKRFEHEMQGNTIRFVKKIIKSDDIWFMHIKVKSKGLNNARVIANKDFLRNLNICKILGYQSLPPAYTLLDNFESSCFVKWSRGNTFFDISKKQHSPLHFNKQNLKSLEQINEIISSNTRKELEERLLKSIEILGLVNEKVSPDIMILFCIISLEKLLLDPKDKETLGWKLGERISFLIGDEVNWMINFFHIDVTKIKPTKKALRDKIVDSRIQLFHKVKDFYDIRSSVTHYQKKPKNVSDEDVQLCYLIVVFVIDKLLELRERGIKEIIYDKNDISERKESSLYYWIDKKSIGFNKPTYEPHLSPIILSM